MALVLATPADYLEWTGAQSAPANLTPILRSCTTMVLDATKLAVYDADVDGNATDSSIAEALKDAVCIQAAAWVALNIDPSTGGIAMSSVKKTKKLLTASIEYADSDAAAAARTAAYTTLVPNAVSTLRLAGLLRSFVMHS